MAPRRPADGHGPDDEALTNLPRASRSTSPTALPRIHYLLADAMDEAVSDHGGMVAVVPGAPTMKSINDQIESVGSTSGSPRA
jgi:hypothetical protein